LTKPHFIGKNILPSEQFETPMNMEITTIKTFCDFDRNFLKNSHFGHKLRKISGNPVLQPSG